MPDYSAHVMVCTNEEGSEDKRHCGDKAGLEIRKRFNELLVSHKLADKVTISNIGCTSQHAQCTSDQGSVTIYGPDMQTGGTWYTATAADVEQIVTEHLKDGRVVNKLLNNQRKVRFT